MKKSLFPELDALVKSKSCENPIAVFDLDGTLFDVTYRTIEILKRFLGDPQIQEKFPEECAKARQIKYENFLYTLEGSLTAIGIDRYSEHSGRFLLEAEKFWFERFFKDEYIAFDKPYSGAKECVDYFYKNGFKVAYLSGRDVPNMCRGTLESLETHGFPLRGENVLVCLKPSFGMEDLQFKKDALHSINRTGNILVTFDNEPANVDFFADTCGKGLHYHFHSHFARPLQLNPERTRVIHQFEEIGFFKNE